MKQLIAALLLATFSLLAMAKETITIVYSWGASDQAANFYRTLATESNKIQDKYNFIIDYKPGAGGSIAAKYVESNTNVILANSSALFIRPIFYPEGSHDPIMFKSIMPMCLAPLVIVSGKYKSWTDVPTNKPITIGHSGNGSTTHLIAVQIAEKFPNLEIIPFKSTSDAFISTIQGSTDFAVGFVGDADGWQDTGKLGKNAYLLGTSGSIRIKNIPLLTAQGFPSILKDMTAAQQLFVSNKFPDDKFKEIRSIFVKAAREESVKHANAQDYCVPNNQMAHGELDAWFTSQANYWKRVATPVVAKQ